MLEVEKLPATVNPAPEAAATVMAEETLDIVDQASEESFPASDAPSFTPLVSIGPPRNGQS